MSLCHCIFSIIKAHILNSVLGEAGLLLKESYLAHVVIFQVPLEWHVLFESVNQHKMD